MVGVWIGAKLSAGPTAGIGGGSLLVRYTFDTPAADANGYVSETGAKALAVWVGAASVAGGLLQSTAAATMRARCNAGAQPGYWKAVFATPADITAAEFYLDFRDNATSRLSAAVENTRIYLFDGYTTTTLDQTAITLAPSTTYTVEVTDVGNLVTVYLNGALRVSGSTASGAGATSGGVTTVSKITTIDTLEARA